MVASPHDVIVQQYRFFSISILFFCKWQFIQLFQLQQIIQIKFQKMAENSGTWPLIVCRSPLKILFVSFCLVLQSAIKWCCGLLILTWWDQEFLEKSNKSENILQSHPVLAHSGTGHRKFLSGLVQEKNAKNAWENSPFDRSPFGSLLIEVVCGLMWKLLGGVTLLGIQIYLILIDCHLKAQP